MSSTFIIIAVLAVLVYVVVSVVSRKKKAEEEERRKQQRIASEKKAVEVKKAAASVSPFVGFDKKPKEKTAIEKEHGHPAETPNTRKEVAYTEEGMGGEITEGCEEHYYERIVAVDEEASTGGTLSPLSKYIVMGEVLNEPRFKNGHRRR